MITTSTFCRFALFVRTTHFFVELYFLSKFVAEDFFNYYSRIIVDPFSFLIF